MAKLDSVTRHAITAPVFDGTKLHRDRLVDAIHANIPRKLIAIAAPPGYGKTTLLADFTAHTDLPVCWVRMTEADKDVFRFANLLNHSMQKRFRRLRGKIDLENLFGTKPEALARVYAEIIDETIGETFVIVLDDVHLVNPSEATTAFLDSFLEVLPDQVTLIASGREVIEVSLAKLMAEGDLAGLGPQDLALTEEEIIALANLQSGLELTQEHAARLLEETKGWVTGLILSGEIAGKDIPSLVFDARPMVYEYLASVVLNRQPDDLRRFMLDSAVFPVMTVAGCDEILQRKDSQRYLTRLLREGLFVSATNETPRTYEYHPQFREFLLDSARGADPKRLKRLQNQAASYLEKQGAIEEAVDLYLAAGKPGRAARLAEKHAEAMFQQGRWLTLQDWATRLQGSGIAIPQVLLHVALVFYDQGKTDEAQAWLARAKKEISSKTAKSVRALAEIIQGRIGVRQLDFPLAESAAKRAMEHLRPRGQRLRKIQCLRLQSEIAARAKGDFIEALRLSEIALKEAEASREKWSIANSLLDIALYQGVLGFTRQAQAASLRAHEVLLELGAPLTLAVSFNNLAYFAHYEGRYEEALDLFNEGLKNARRADTLRLEAGVLLGQADLFSDLDLMLQAAELYGQALTLAAQIDDEDLMRYGCLQTSAVHRRRGNEALAYEWINRALEVGEARKTNPSIAIHLGALEAASRPDHVLKGLVPLAEDESAGLEAAQRTLLLYVLAKAAHTKGDDEATLDHLKRALDWAGAHATEQVLAGELAFDEALREFAQAHLRGHPVLGVVMRRIDAMRALAQQYKESGDEEEVAGAYRFAALGAAEVRGARADLSQLKPLAREVLFFLLDHGRVERDVILETFWPHHPPGRQVANLHTAIYSLRRLLGKDLILHDGVAYSINPEMKAEYDVERFERAAAIAEGLPLGDPRRMFALTEAVNTYGGRFLPEFASDWVLERRRQLEMRYLDLLAQQAREAMVRDQPARALQTLREALEIDPYRDDMNLQYLEALGRLGRRSEAVEHYQRYVRLLANELGLDPPEEVRAFYAKLIG